MTFNFTVDLDAYASGRKDAADRLKVSKTLEYATIAREMEDAANMASNEFTKNLLLSAAKKYRMAAKGPQGAMR